MEKKCILTQSPSLFDTPGTEALALRNFAWFDNHQPAQVQDVTK